MKLSLAVFLAFVFYSCENKTVLPSQVDSIKSDSIRIPEPGILRSPKDTAFKIYLAGNGCSLDFRTANYSSGMLAFQDLLANNSQLKELSRLSINCANTKDLSDLICKGISDSTQKKLNDPYGTVFISHIALREFISKTFLYQDINQAVSTIGMEISEIEIEEKAIFHDKRDTLSEVKLELDALLYFKLKKMEAKIN
jgi:hypothetical protein